MSTGITNLAELSESVEHLHRNGCTEMILLKCTSTYPASPENTNLHTIPHMRDLFNCEVGLSDHTMGVGAAVAAVALGASVIEKHFCLSRAEGGVDSSFSLEPHEMKLLVEETRRAWEAMGTIQYGIQDAEKKSLKDIEEGELFTEENIRVIRPGDGLEPKYYTNILNKRASKALKKGIPFNLEYIK
jgi:N-acetylneuraminate synthase